MNEQLALVPLDLNGSSLFYFRFVRCLSTLVSITTEGAVVNSGSLWFTFDDHVLSENVWRLLSELYCASRALDSYNALAFFY